MPFRFITLKPDRIFGIAEEWIGGLPIRVTDRERTLVDILDRPDLAGGVAEVGDVLAQAWRDVNAARLTEYVGRLGSGTVPKRLGYLAELLALDVGEDQIEHWRARAGSGISLLERGGSKDGRIVTRWGLRINTGTNEMPL